MASAIWDESNYEPINAQDFHLDFRMNLITPMVPIQILQSFADL